MNWQAPFHLCFCQVSHCLWASVHITSPRGCLRLQLGTSSLHPSLETASEPHTCLCMHPHHPWLLGHIQVFWLSLSNQGAGWAPADSLSPHHCPCTSKARGTTAPAQAPPIRSCSLGEQVEGIAHSLPGPGTPAPHGEKLHVRTLQAFSSPPQAGAQDSQQLPSPPEPRPQSPGGAHPAGTRTSCSRC